MYESSEIYVTLFFSTETLKCTLDTYIETLESTGFVYGNKTEPTTHVFDVELRNICKYFPLFGTDFILGQFLKPNLPKGLFKIKVCKMKQMYMLWFNFILALNVVFLCFKLISIHNHTQNFNKNKI